MNIDEKYTQEAAEEDFHRGTINTTQKKAPEYIAARSPFRASSLRGQLLAVVGHPLQGKLPDKWWRQFKREDPSYVVLSYSTPIAWYSPDHGWTIPDERYSATTSKHQKIVANSIG